MDLDPTISFQKLFHALIKQIGRPKTCENHDIKYIWYLIVIQVNIGQL